jgi:hypothetical protein
MGEYTITALTSEPNIRVKTCHTTLSGKGFRLGQAIP